MVLMLLVILDTKELKVPKDIRVLEVLKVKQEMEL